MTKDNLETPLDPQLLIYLVIKGRNLACCSLDKDNNPDLDDWLKQYVNEVDKTLGFLS